MFIHQDRKVFTRILPNGKKKRYVLVGGTKKRKAPKTAKGGKKRKTTAWTWDDGTTAMFRGVTRGSQPTSTTIVWPETGTSRNPLNLTGDEDDAQASSSVTKTGSKKAKKTSAPARLRHIHGGTIRHSDTDGTCMFNSVTNYFQQNMIFHDNIDNWITTQFPPRTVQGMANTGNGQGNVGLFQHDLRNRRGRDLITLAVYLGTPGLTNNRWRLNGRDVVLETPGRALRFLLWVYVRQMVFEPGQSRDTIQGMLHMTYYLDAVYPDNNAILNHLYQEGQDPTTVWNSRSDSRSNVWYRQFTDQPDIVLLSHMLGNTRLYVHRRQNEQPGPAWLFTSLSVNPIMLNGDDRLLHPGNLQARDIHIYYNGEDHYEWLTHPLVHPENPANLE
jgi:hypothetical protein